MQLVRRSNPFKKGCLITAATSAVLIVSFYLLLSSGALEGLIRRIVLRATSGSESVVFVYGGTSNLFSSTSFDSVIVTNDRGLKISVHGASVTGSVFYFLLGPSVESINVDSLIVISPSSSSEESADSTLASAFKGALAGFVTKAERIQVDYGRIVDQDGVLLLDSIQLNVSIPDIENATIEVISAASFIPLFGRVSIDGVLGVDTLSISLTDFTIIAPPCSLEVAGTLNADSTIDFSISGAASTSSFPALPFCTVMLSCGVTGSISDPHAQLALTEGYINYNGIPLEFSADTITADLRECSLGGLAASTEGVSSSISGKYTYNDQSWNSLVLLSFQNTDISSYFPDLPETDITGTFSISGYGVEDLPELISASGNFTNSEIDLYPITDLSFNCSGNTTGIDGQVSVVSESVSLESVFSLSMGNHLDLVAWSGDLDLNITSLEMFPSLIDPSLSGVRGISAAISGEGNRSALAVSGIVGIDSFSGDDAIVEGAYFNGNVSKGTSGISATGSIGIGALQTDDIQLSEVSYVGSLRGGDFPGNGNVFDFTAVGRAEIGSFSTEELSAERAHFNGNVSLGNFGLRANGLLGIGNLSSKDFKLSEISYVGFFRSAENDVEASGVLACESFSMIDTLGATAREARAYLDVQLSKNRQSAVCSLLVSEAGYGGILADSIRFNGDLFRERNEISGTGSLIADAIVVGGDSYSVCAQFNAEPGIVQVDSIRIVVPGKLELELSGLFSYSEDRLGINIDGISLMGADSLRLISTGDIDFHTDSYGFFLDTLRFNLPNGEIIAEGFFTTDSLDASAKLVNVDVSSFASMLVHSVPLSGRLDIDASFFGTMGDIQTELDLLIDHPTYGEWDQSDSLTLNLSSSGDSLIINGLWSWSKGVPSGLKMGFDGIWNNERILDIQPYDIMWLEAELTDLGDEFFYLLPSPLNTSGATVSARVDYIRDTAEFSAGLSSHFDKLFLTNPGIELPGVSVYMTYPSVQEDDRYNGILTMNSGERQQGTLQSTILFDVEEDLEFSNGSLPFELKGYSFQADFRRWETLIAGMGWIQFSGALRSSSSSLSDRPKISGNIEINAATVSPGGGGGMESSTSSTSSTSSSDELPIDLDIRIIGKRGIWFRNNYSNVELSTQIDITTVGRRLLVGGDIRAIRGEISLLGREFRITRGEIKIIQTIPLGIELDIQAQAKIRSSVSGEEYLITVSVTGDPEDPDILLSATGPSGVISEQDMVALLTAGMTYGELQQFDSSALGNVAGNYLGQWLARSIREDIGLDALQFSPDFSSATTSLVVNAGKYVLPDLFVSFSSDVFSSSPGVVSGQYFINRDFFLEGSTKSTFSGNHNPSLELHYRFSY